MSMSTSRMDLCAIYAHARPERVVPVKITNVIHRATGESAFKPAAKPAAKPAKARKVSGPGYRVVEGIMATK